MPELPEVQTTVKGIREHIKNLNILDVWTSYDSPSHRGKDDIKDPVFFKKFREAVRGVKIIGAERRGKNILMNLSNGKTILIHMKMTGHVMYGKYGKEKDQETGKEIWKATEPGPLRDDPFNRFIRLVFSLSDGKHLVLSDMRKFAKVTVGDTEKIHQSDHLLYHGPEPLDPDFDARKLRETLMRRPNRPVKQVIMDHEVISGIGNIYSDEILWRAGIHPLEHVKNIPDKKWPVIWKAMRGSLKSGIDFGGDSMSDYRNILGQPGKFQKKHNAYRKTGEECSRPGCSGVILRLKIGGRSAHLCSEHQKLLKK